MRNEKWRGRSKGKPAADITDVTYVTTVTTFSDHIYKIMKIENGNKKMIECLKKAVTVVTNVRKVTMERAGAAYDNCNNYYNYFFTPIYNFMKTENGEKIIIEYAKIVVIVVIVVISDVNFQFVAE